MKQDTNKSQQLTVGMDLSDRTCHLCVLDAGGEVVEETRLTLTEAALRRRFEPIPACRVALEVGTHSPWVSRVLEDCGHEVVVANARKVQLIAKSKRKNDRTDAELLARIARLDPKLLAPIRHRGPQAQADLAVIRSRDALVRARTMLVNHARGSVKSVGARLPKRSAASFHKLDPELLPEALRPALAAVLETTGQLTARIRQLDRDIQKFATERYPVTAVLQQVVGVGPLTSVAFVLILEDPQRFPKSRTVGAFLGLAPSQRESGKEQPELRISKEGDILLRRLLVSAAQYILGPFGPDTDLRRWGLKLAARGGKNAKKRAVVAVARRLAVLLHRLWVTGEAYEPLRQAGDQAA